MQNIPIASEVIDDSNNVHLVITYSYSSAYSSFLCLPMPVQLDPRYPTLRSRLAGWENRGLLLRWASALNNMEAVKSIPKDRMDAFVSRQETV